MRYNESVVSCLPTLPVPVCHIATLQEGVNGTYRCFIPVLPLESGRQRSDGDGAEELPRSADRQRAHLSGVAAMMETEASASMSRPANTDHCRRLKWVPSRAASSAAAAAAAAAVAPLSPISDTSQLSQCCPAVKASSSLVIFHFKQEARQFCDKFRRFDTKTSEITQIWPKLNILTFLDR